MRGGKRPGAGRKARAVKQIESSIAELVFRNLGGEAGAWEKLIDFAYGKLVLVNGKPVRIDKVKPGEVWTLVGLDRLNFIKEIAVYWTDRKYGKPAQRAEVIGDGGGPIQVVVDL